MSKSNMRDVTIFLPPDVDDDIMDRLSYGDSKSGWIRDAVEERLERECDTVEIQD